MGFLLRDHYGHTLVLFFMTHTSSRVRICYFYNKSSWFTMNIIENYDLIIIIIFIRTKTTCYRNNERKANIPNTKNQLSKRANTSQMDLRKMMSAQDELKKHQDLTRSRQGWVRWVD